MAAAQKNEETKHAPGNGPVGPRCKDGKLLPLAVSTAQRAPLMPGVSVIQDVVPGAVHDHWYGLVAPASSGPWPTANTLRPRAASTSGAAPIRPA